MKRFTDAALFGVLFLLASIAWAIMALSHTIPRAEVGGLAPMTVAVAVVISVPALLLLTVMALLRATFDIAPKSFWILMAGGTALAALAVFAAKAIANAQGIELGFATTIWFLSIVAVSSFMAWVLALTGALPRRDAQSDKADPTTVDEVQVTQDTVVVGDAALVDDAAVVEDADDVGGDEAQLVADLEEELQEDAN